MKAIFYPLFILLSLSSCCHTYDSTIEQGKSFGDYQELKFDLLRSKYYSKFHEVFKSNKIDSIINDTVCNKLIKSIDSTCDCNEIDFNKNMLIGLHGIIPHEYSISSYGYSPRVVINHRYKILTVEVRGYKKTCSSETNLSGPKAYNEILLVPAIPRDYKIFIDYFSPVMNDGFK